MLKSEFRLVLMTAFHMFRRHLVEHGILGDAGIVDENINRSKLGFHRFDAGRAGLIA